MAVTVGGMAPFMQFQTLSTSANIMFSANQARQRCKVHNSDAAIAIFVGPSNSVTSAGANGFRIAPGQTETFENWIGDMYGVAASGTPVAFKAEW